MLKAHVTGNRADAPPLLIAHGLFGSARNWRAIARRLGKEREVITVDMRNHGESPRAGSQSYEEMAADLAEVIAAHGGRADVLGHSMGGKAAMALALARPEMVRRLIVADIAPVAYEHADTHRDLIAAMQALDPAAFTTRAEADAALARHVADPAIRAFLLQSLDLGAGRWRLNLPVLARELETITGWPDIRAVFEGPALFIAGGNSDYILPEHRATIRRLFPRARLVKIPGAGHWLHAEKPREFSETVRLFLNS